LFGIKEEDNFVQQDDEEIGLLTSERK